VKNSDAPTRLERFSDILNPLLVREIRQSLRSHVFAGGVIITSFICMVTIICGVLWSNYGRITPDNSAGKDLFSFILFVLWLFICAVIPVYSANRFRTERAKGEFELFRITGVKASQIISGKLQSSIIQALLFVFLSAPFMMVCYLLRGVSSIDIIVCIAMTFIHAVFLVQAGILIASLKVSTPFFTMLNLAYIGLILFNFSIFGILASQGYSNVFDLFAGTGAIAIFAFFLAYFYVFLLLFMSSSALIDDSNSDRTFAIRTMSLFSAVIAPPFFILIGDLKEVSLVALYVFFYPILLIASMLVHQKPNFSKERVARFWEGRWGKLLKPLKFMLYCSRSNLYLWLSTMVLILSFWEYLGIDFLANSAGDDWPYVLTITSTMVFIWSSIGYAIMSLAFPSAHVVLKSLAGCFVPSLFALFFAYYDEGTISYLLCPFTTFIYFNEKDPKLPLYPFYMIWGVVCIASLIHIIFTGNKK
jgi:hypothetical protein